MKEENVRAALVELFIYVAALPWKDIDFVRSEVAKQAATDAILDATTQKIMELNKEEYAKETN